MRESVSYTATINIVVIFILIFFFFLSATLMYFKINRSGKIITDSIEKYEGYNILSETAIYQRLLDIGYNMKKVKCKANIRGTNTADSVCKLMKTGANSTSYSQGKRGYCIYYCNEGDYYYYKVSTKGLIEIPLIKNIISIPVVTTTNRMYNFEDNLK